MDLQTILRTLPDREEVVEQIPSDRQAYVQAANEFSSLEIVRSIKREPIAARLSATGLRRAVHVLSDAARADELQPPLPEGLADVLGRFSDAMRARESDYEERASSPPLPHHIEKVGSELFIQISVRSAAQLAVVAALDHGSALPANSLLS